MSLLESAPRRLLLGTGLFLAGALLLGPRPADAQEETRHPRSYEPKILVHAVPWEEGQRINCFAHGTETVDDISVSIPLDGTSLHYLIYVLAADFSPEWGMAGIQFGIAYNDEPGVGIDVDGWQDCTDLEWHLEDWPLAGTGNLLTWHQKNNCQQQEPAVVGLFLVEVHSPDRFRLIPRPVDGIASVVSCGLTIHNSAERTFEIPRAHLGYIQFGTDEPGYNPWDPEQSAAKRAEAGKSGK